MLDNTNILSEEILLRRVSTKNPNMWKVDSTTGEKRASSAAFAIKTTGVCVWGKNFIKF